MKRVITRYFLIISLVIPFSPFLTYGQDITGIWKGYFITESGEYYKLEFQVVQNSSFGVTGISYSYLDVRFYGKATMTGSFIRTSSSFRIREIRTVEVRSSMGGGTCIMNYNFSYSRSGKEEFLEGTYLGKYESKYASATGTWGDCGSGKVFLRKVNSTDFYVEPFLKNKIKPRTVIINMPPIKKDTARVNTNPITKPEIKIGPPVTKPISKPPLTKPLVKPITTDLTRRDTTKAKPVITPITKTNLPVRNPTPSVIRDRTNELVKVLVVNDPDVTVKLYDNGEIDGDTISVYLDKKLVLSAKRLTASPLIVKLKMEEDNSEHELTMVAENLGTIPPNTSLMIVEAGEQRFDVRITSTEQKNAVVRFKYQKLQ